MSVDVHGHANVRVPEDALHGRRLSPTLSERVPQSIGPVSPVWDRYMEERSRCNQERVAEREHTAEQQRDEWRCMSERHRRERTDILGQSWMGRGELLNATRSILAARRAQEKAELRDQHKVERTALQKEHGHFLVGGRPVHDARRLRSSGVDLDTRPRHGRGFRRQRVDNAIDIPIIRIGDAAPASGFDPDALSMVCGDGGRTSTAVDAADWTPKSTGTTTGMDDTIAFPPRMKRRTRDWVTRTPGPTGRRRL